MSLTNIVLIGCGIASLWAWSSSTHSIWHEWGLAPYRMRENHEWYRLLTSPFFHTDIFHLLLNGVAFHSFGSEMEAFYGKKLYAMLLLAGALGSGMLTYLRYSNNPLHLSIGLSGVVNAVVFSFIVWRPTATLMVWFLPLPAWLFAILYLAYSLYEAQRGGSYINHWAHIGGAASGVIFAYLVSV